MDVKLTLAKLPPMSLLLFYILNDLSIKQYKKIYDTLCDKKEIKLIPPYITLIIINVLVVIYKRM